MPIAESFSSLTLSLPDLFHLKQLFDDPSGESSAFTHSASRNARINTQLDMAKISSVKAREILDSRGNPTVEVRLVPLTFCLFMMMCTLCARDYFNASFVIISYFQLCATRRTDSHATEIFV